MKSFLLLTAAIAFGFVLAASPASAEGRETVLFIGSSTIGHWDTLDRDFPRIHSINRGVNGTDFAFLIQNVADWVRQDRPDRVVVYSGDNDLASGASPEDVARGLRRTIALIRAARPRTAIVALSIKPSPARVELIPKIRDANRLLAAVARAEDAIFVDTFHAMMTSAGTVRAEFYGKDPLHMNAFGYRTWTRLLAPALR